MSIDVDRRAPLTSRSKARESSDEVAELVRTLGRSVRWVYESDWQIGIHLVLEGYYFRVAAAELLTAERFLQFCHSIILLGCVLRICLKTGLALFKRFAFALEKF